MSDNNLEEKAMSDAEMEKREKIVKSMKKNIDSFRKRYGDRAKEVMYATATKQAMKEETEELDEAKSLDKMTDAELSAAFDANEAKIKEKGRVTMGHPLIQRRRAINLQKVINSKKSSMKEEQGVAEGTTPGMAALKKPSMAQQEADQKKREAEKAAAQSKAAEKRIMDWAKSTKNEEVESDDYKMDKLGRKHKAHKIMRDDEEENDEVEITNADKKAKQMKEELKGNQHKIDANKNNKIDAHDFKLLRKKYKEVAEEYIKLAEQDLLAMRGLFSTNPGAVPPHMAKTPEGKRRTAKRNIEPLKNRISKALGKHPKPNLPEETYVLSDVFGAGIVLTNEHAEPDADGIIDWYAVEFDHGKEKVFVEDLELMAAQYEALIEQIEQIDELSTNLKLRYLKKAGAQVKALEKEARVKQRELRKLPLGGPETEKAVADLSANAGKQIDRSVGMAHAVRKLATKYK